MASDRSDLPEDAPASERKALLAVLVLLALLSFWISATRVYQVDEAQNAYMAWMMGQPPAVRGYVSAPIFLVPFAWLAKTAGDAAGVFLRLRLGFLLLFWVNLILLVKACGLSLRRREGLWTLLAALLVPPLWTYGLEVRHENFILLGLLGLWIAGRRGAARPWSYAAVGGIAVAMQLCAFKSLAYWGPISLALLLFPPVTSRRRRRLLAEWLAGAGAAALLGVLIHLAAGTLGAFVADQAGLFRAAAAVPRFGPWSALSRLGTQAPLLLAVTVLPGLACLGRLWREGRPALRWEGPLPELLLWLWCVALLGVNPNPFPYNLVPVVAASVLLAVALARSETWPPILEGKGLKPLLVGLLLFGQGLPFLAQVSSLLESPNDRQLRLMAWAEALTDPARDTVFDGAGLVPGRRSPLHVWYVNITNTAAFDQAADGPLRKALQRDAPAVVIPTYRFSYLDREDLEALQQAYVALAPDFLVLGGNLRPGSQTWECLHAGRYAVLPMGAPVKVDGQVLGPGPITLARGPHTLELPEGLPSATIQWVGPKLDRPLAGNSDGVTPGVFPIPNAF